MTQSIEIRLTYRAPRRWVLACAVVLARLVSVGAAVRFATLFARLRVVG